MYCHAQDHTVMHCGVMKQTIISHVWAALPGSVWDVERQEWRNKKTKNGWRDLNWFKPFSRNLPLSRGEICDMWSCDAIPWLLRLWIHLCQWIPGQLYESCLQLMPRGAPGASLFITWHIQRAALNATKGHECGWFGKVQMLEPQWIIQRVIILPQIAR